MPAGLTALLNLIGGIGQQLLDSFTYIFGWVFTINNGSLTLIPIFMMVLVFIKEFLGHIIRGFR